MLRHLIAATVRPRYAVRSSYDRRFLDQEPLRRLKDKFKGQTVLVVGNGPSLNSTPMDIFTDQPSIGMNKIDLLFQKTSWRPSMTICVNSIVVKQHKQAFSQSAIPVFIPTKAKRMLGGLPLRNGGFFTIKPSRQFSTNILEGVGMADTVTFTALQFAYYLGAKNVVLVGVDHSYNTKQKDAKKYEKKTSDDKDHFDPNYFAKGQLWGIPDLEKSELIYKYAKESFEADGRTILDATIGGKLEIFDKITIEQATALFHQN